MRTRIGLSMLILLLAAGCGSGDIPTPVPSNTPTPSAQDGKPADETDRAAPVEPASNESASDTRPKEDSASEEKSTEPSIVARDPDSLDQPVSLPAGKVDAEPSTPSEVSSLDATQLVAKLADADDRDVVTRQLVAQGSAAVEPLLGALKSDNWEIRASAIFCLGQLGAAGKPALPQLEDIAKNDEVAAVRDAAAFAIDSLEGRAEQP